MCLINVLMNPCKIATPQEKTQCVSWFIETKSYVQTQKNLDLSMEDITKNLDLSMEDIHHHDLQFIDGTRNL